MSALFLREPCQATLASVRSFGVTDLKAAVDAYERHLDWTYCRTLTSLVRPTSEPWLLRAKTRSDYTAELSEQAPVWADNPADILAQALSIVEDGLIAADDFQWLPSGGWRLSVKGQCVALVEPLKFVAVDDLMRRRVQAVFRGLTEEEPSAAAIRLRTLPGFRHCVPAELELTPRRLNRMLSFSPGLAVRQFNRFADELGLRLSPAACRQVLAKLWGFASWHAVAAKWKSMAWADPHAVWAGDEELAIVSDSASAIALMADHARRKGRAWCESHQTCLSSGAFHLRPGLALRSAESSSSGGQGSSRFGSSVLSTSALDAACARLASTETRAHEAWGEDIARRLGDVPAVLGVGLTPEQFLNRTCVHAGTPVQLRVRNLHFCRTQSVHEEASRLFIVALDGCTQPVSTEGVLNEDGRFFVDESLCKAHATVENGRCWVHADHGRRPVLFLEHLTLEETASLRRFFDRG